MKVTALNSVHRSLGAKMVEFAGYDMPLQYSEGMLKEHEWVRADDGAGLFDVSHMGQVLLEGAEAANFLSYITPTSFKNLPKGVAKYSVLTNEAGGIIDDLIISKLDENRFFLVINAGCKEKDLNWLQSKIPTSLVLSVLSDYSLIALQGSRAEKVLQEQLREGNLSDLPYMNIASYLLKDGYQVLISRTGYSGEDGFEISLPNSKAEELWLKLMSDPKVKPIGLGARDSLRLEAGYPLYGHDLDETTSPIEASISWIVSKDNENFIGTERILKEKRTLAISRKRMGIKLLERGIAREGSEVRNQKGEKIGLLTSGGFSPILKISIGQGYIQSEYAKPGEEVRVVVRDREIKALLQNTVFVAPRTRAAKAKN